MLVDCMFYQPGWSLTESQFRCLGYLNPNSLIGTTVNQFETQVTVDISIRCFSYVLRLYFVFQKMSFISVVNLSMSLLFFSANNFFISVSLDYFRLSHTINFFN